MVLKRRPSTILVSLTAMVLLLIAFAPGASAERPVLNDGGDSSLAPAADSAMATLPGWAIIVLLFAVVVTAALTAFITAAVTRSRARPGRHAAAAA
jgi:hypothetical protein